LFKISKYFNSVDALPARCNEPLKPQLYQASNAISTRNLHHSDIVSPRKSRDPLCSSRWRLGLVYAASSARRGKSARRERLRLVNRQLWQRLRVFIGWLTREFAKRRERI
jgi:hypothetical protein